MTCPVNRSVLIVDRDQAQRFARTLSKHSASSSRLSVLPHLHPIIQRLDEVAERISSLSSFISLLRCSNTSSPAILSANDRFALFNISRRAIFVPCPFSYTSLN